MILSWKAVALDAFQAEWQGMSLLLQREPSTKWALTLVSTIPGAVLEINGESIWASKRRWASARAGMQAVDESLTKIIMRKAREHGNVVINRLPYLVHRAPKMEAAGA